MKNIVKSFLVVIAIVGIAVWCGTANMTLNDLRESSLSLLIPPWRNFTGESICSRICHGKAGRKLLSARGNCLKILIYGAGVIGSIFAGKLALAKNDVTVLARGKRFEELKNDGIALVNPRTKKVGQAKVNVIDALLPEDSYDYIIVAMQRT